MKYSFPITVNMRAFLPSVDKTFGAVEENFKILSGGESVRLSCQAPIMNFDVDVSLPMNDDQIKLVHSTLMPLLIEKFPNCNITIDKPIISR